MCEENLPSSTSFVASSHEHRTVRPAATPRQPNPPVFTQTRTGGRGGRGGRTGGRVQPGGAVRGRPRRGWEGAGTRDGAGPRARVLGGGRGRRAGKGADEGSGWYCARRARAFGQGRWESGKEEAGGTAGAGGRGQLTDPRPPGPLSAAPRRRASTTHHSLRARAPTAATRCSNLTCRSLGQRCFNGGSA